MACKPANATIPIKAMPISRPAKKYTKQIGLAAASAPYFPLLQKKRRIKTNPARTPKTIPRKKMDQTLSLNGSNILVSPFFGGGSCSLPFFNTYSVYSCGPDGMFEPGTENAACFVEVSARHFHFVRCRPHDDSIEFDFCPARLACYLQGLSRRTRNVN